MAELYNKILIMILYYKHDQYANNKTIIIITFRNRTETIDTELKLFCRCLFGDIHSNYRPFWQRRVMSDSDVVLCR